MVGGLRSYVVRVRDDIALLGRAWIVLLVLGLACTPPEATPPQVVPTGSHEVDLQAVARHARQFDEELPSRPAGSQQEEIAATYILGHLQQAGYVARLDAVPVADLVRSTNVIAVPPSGEEPSILVATPYDTSEDGSGDGRALGVFLELARALRVAHENHSVEFVALGAERTTMSGGHLGVRRLVQLLQDEEQAPFVVLIDDLSAGAPFHAEGPGAARLGSYEGDTSMGPGSPRKTVPAGAGSRATLGILTEAGFEAVVVGGDRAIAGKALLGWLLQQEI